MKTLVSALMVAGSLLSTTAANYSLPSGDQIPVHLTAAEEGEPKNSPKYAVQTYIENFNERDFEAMRKVLSDNFTNQGLNRDGSLTPVQKIDDLKVMMVGQEAINSDSQDNLITITEIKGDVATAELITGPEGQRWKEYITLVRVGDGWKIEKIFWNFL